VCFLFDLLLRQWGIFTLRAFAPCRIPFRAEDYEAAAAANRQRGGEAARLRTPRPETPDTIRPNNQNG